MSDPNLITALQPAPAGATAVALQRALQLQVGAQDTQQGSADDTLSLQDLFRIVLKHKWILIVVMLAAAATAGVRTLLSTPLYRSTVTLQFHPNAPRIVEFNGADSGGYIDESVLLKTQFELLKSRSLAERVLDDLGLVHASNKAGVPGVPEAQAPASASSGFMSQVLGGYRKLTTPATKDQEILSRDRAVGALMASIAVEPVRNSRLMRLHVDNSNPELAARIANATVQNFITSGIEQKVETSLYAKNFLEDQIKQVKVRLEESERRLNQYAQSKNILTLDEKTNVISQTYTEFANAVAKAEQERIKVESAYEQLRQDPDNAQQVLDSKTIQTYKDARAKLEVEYQQNLGTYKPEFPKMVQLRAQIEKVEAQIKAEVAAISGAVLSQLRSARLQESQLKGKLGETRSQVLSTQDSSIDLNLLKREVDTNRQLYDGLLQRLKQVNVVADLASNNITVVDKAEAPLLPFKPNMRQNVLIGLAIGLVIGLCLVFALEYLDDSIKMPDEVERALGVPLMGIVPMAPKRPGTGTVALEVHRDPRSGIAEAYRSLRTALQFSTTDGAPRRLVITSTTRDEGKSTTALSLAISFAQLGQKVLLIDADMRNPSVHKLLGVTNDFGLSNLLSGDYGAETLIQETEIPNLVIMAAGPIPPNPVDLLMGPKFSAVIEQAASHGVHYVLVDAPPLLGIADSVVLGNQIQNILFVVHAGRTRKSQIKDALRRLRMAGLAPRGIVLTQVRHGSANKHYESYYGYGAASEKGTLMPTKSAT
ncbi:MAG: polysaccharide biosynthesis tyrosine autokinase [Pseudomonadota bacterium]